MNPQPTIFISSIISEFYDLRGALRYFLGKSGFRVLMSEEADFGADSGLDSLDNCKNQIEKSDYYMLLIGDKSGYTFDLDGNKTSVTFEEFRHYIKLVQEGKKLNFIAFVRSKTWVNYVAKDTTKIDQIQIDFIEELINNSLFEDHKIGRWRYSFDKFSDIITVLETNQNGLFLDSTRKSGIYKQYIKKEINEILRAFLNKKKESEELYSIMEFFDIPDLKFGDLKLQHKLPKEIAVKVVGLLIVTNNKENLLSKINRVFNYIAQGEFSKFDAAEEKYILPEYIKLTIQALEILEKNFSIRKNNKSLDEMQQLDVHDYRIFEIQYWSIRDLHSDLKIALAKLINVFNCLHNNWTDLEKKPDEFYTYRGTVQDGINDEQIINYVNSYFDK